MHGGSIFIFKIMSMFRQEKVQWLSLISIWDQILEPSNHLHINV